jgi:hypothetical protein
VPGNQKTTTLYRPSQNYSIHDDGRHDSAGIQPHRSPADLASLSATSPDARNANYSRNPIHVQPWMMAGEAVRQSNQQYVRMPLLPPHPVQEMIPSQYFGLPYPQPHQPEGFQTHYSGGSITYNHPQSFGHSYPQHLQQLQAQAPIVYGPVGAGFYPMQQQFARQNYDATAGAFPRQEPYHCGISHTPGQSAIHGSVSAGQSRSALVQADGTCESPKSSLLQIPHFY